MLIREHFAKITVYIVSAPMNEDLHVSGTDCGNDLLC